MRLRLALPLLLALLLPAAASASCTWSTTSYGVQAVCTTGTEANALSATDGIALTSGWGGARGLSVHIETAGTMTAGGTLQAYIFNPVTSSWNRAPDNLDLPVQALAKEAWYGLPLPLNVERIAWLPSGVGIAGTIYINKG